MSFQQDWQHGAALSMESRSILKSIHTEDTKLHQSNHLTRQDLHYFRARYNYYRLSLTRLSADERIMIEPELQKFLESIHRAEGQQDGQVEMKPPPFLSPVENLPKEVAREPIAAPRDRSPVREQASGPVSKTEIREACSLLSLIRLAIQADMTPEAKRLLGEHLDRAIHSLQRLS